MCMSQSIGMFIVVIVPCRKFPFYDSPVFSFCSLDVVTFIALMEMPAFVIYLKINRMDTKEEQGIKIIVGPHT